MKCPICYSLDTTVKDSRISRDHTTVRRRRICSKCRFRFTTFEGIILRGIKVIKSGGQLENFDNDKLYRSIEVASRKRPLVKEDIAMMVNSIIHAIENMPINQIKSSIIGNLTMEELKKKDLVAYVRFASVYLNFNSIDDFITMIRKSVQDEQ